MFSGLMEHSMSFKPKPPHNSFASRALIAKASHIESKEEEENILGNHAIHSTSAFDKLDRKSGYVSSPRKADGNNFAQTLETKTSIDLATRHWMSVVSSGLPNAPQMTAELYTEDAVIWGTVSKDLRKGRKEILQYFDFFSRQQDLCVVPGSYKSHIQLYGNVAISSGYYTFQFTDGEVTKVVPARFTFIFERQQSDDVKTIDDSGSVHDYLFSSPYRWKIVNHHSSMIPEQPPGLVSIT
jgi:hypothetical protein